MIGEVGVATGDCFAGHDIFGFQINAIGGENELDITCFTFRQDGFVVDTTDFLSHSPNIAHRVANGNLCQTANSSSNIFSTLYTKLSLQ